jgi:hypothetical protein
MRGHSWNWSHAFWFGADNAIFAVGDFDCNGKTDIAAVVDDPTNNGNIWSASSPTSIMNWTLRFGAPGRHSRRR